MTRTALRRRNLLTNREWRGHQYRISIRYSTSVNRASASTPKPSTTTRTPWRTGCSETGSRQVEMHLWRAISEIPRKLRSHSSQCTGDVGVDSSAWAWQLFHHPRWSWASIYQLLIDSARKSAWTRPLHLRRGPCAGHVLESQPKRTCFGRRSEGIRAACPSHWSLRRRSTSNNRSLSPIASAIHH